MSPLAIPALRLLLGQGRGSLSGAPLLRRAAAGYCWGLVSWSADPPGVIAAGLAAAVTAVALAGTGTLDPHGMITSPALHDAANDQPTRFSPVCSRTPIPVCLNPAYAGYLTAVTTALEPVLSEVAGRPGAPVRISQAAAIYQQGPGNSVGILLDGTALRGTPAGPAPTWQAARSRYCAT